MFVCMSDGIRLLRVVLIFIFFLVEFNRGLGLGIESLFGDGFR